MKILIADNQAEFRQKLSARLKEEKFDVAVEADSAFSIFELLPQCTPDILIYNWDMDGRGLETLKEIKKHHKNINLIAIKEKNDKSAIYNFYHYGGSGFLLKTNIFEELSDAVQTVYQGRKYISPKFAGELLCEICGVIPPPITQTQMDKLTRREIEVLIFIKEGKEPKEISDQLYISEGTARQHIKNIMDKLENHTIEHLFLSLLFTEIHPF